MVNKEKRSAPLWLVPNLLSLDAPLVALAWMWMLARALRVEYIETACWWVLPVAVWCVYVVDRVLDGWRHPELREISPRHMFHWENRWPLLMLAIAAAMVCGYNSLYVLSRSVFSAGLVAIIICAIYFLVTIYRTKEVPYFKNVMAGMIFAMGVGIPVNAANANLLVADFNDVIYAFQNIGVWNGVWNFGLMMLTTFMLIFTGSKEVWVLGLLCIMNITAIDIWEQADIVDDEEVIYSHESSLNLGLIFLAGGALVFAAMLADDYSKPFFYAVMVSAALLQQLNHLRKKISLDGLRVLADVAMIVPLFLFFFM